MTDDERFAYETFRVAAARFSGARATVDRLFATLVEAQDAHAEAAQALERAKQELDEASADLIAEITVAPAQEV